MLISKEHWSRVDQLFAAALELEERERARFLDEACAGDSALRREVESMLEYARASKDFLETPPLVDPATLLVDESPRGADDARRETRPRASDNARFIPGDVIAGRYRIAGLLGRGGMGEVYRADDLKLDQPVALKFLAESLSSQGAALARFHREVSLARQISHRYVCRVYDIGEHAGMHFLSMEYVRGEELSSLLKRVGRLPLEKAVETARQLCAGLAAIHAAGVLHRDLKPANVMIDEHGDVRITDFGIAALSEQAGGAEAMIGTPAYMAPEQLAGGDVTARSDLYALGLVLYEAFTGNRPFEARSLEEILSVQRSDTVPTRPSAWVTGLDPIVERVILRCLEKDPQRRPASALQVAAALPGGDPLAAALAAGETPSPQMVAAAAKEGSLRPARALALLAWIVAGVAGIALFSDRVSLHRFVPLERSPELLRTDAEEIAEEAGYAGAPADSAWGFGIDPEVLEYVTAHDRRPDRWERFRDAPLPAISFWYRRSPRPLDPYSSWSVHDDDPPNAVPGMVRMRLDPSGRLIRFEAAPPREDAGTVRSMQFDWSRFFERAGLDMARFRAAPPRWTPPQHGDERRSWVGVHPSRADLPLRVEAASYRGKPVYFEVVWPWMQPDRQTAGDPFSIVLIILYFGAIALAALLAWTNVRLGRGDRRGAFRLALVIFAARIVYWLFMAHHIAAIGEVFMFVEALQSAVYWAALLGLLYLALEPFVRRRWPEALISWSRLLSGDLRDPLVGRDVLIGGAFGIAVTLAIHLYFLLPPLMGRPMPAPSMNSPLLYQHGLEGARGFLPLLINAASASIMMPLILTALVVFFVMLTRRNDAGIAVSWIILYAALSLRYSDGTPAAYLIGLIVPTILLVVLTRHGLLALCAAFYFTHIWPFYPATTDLSAWYATTFLMQLAVLAAIVLFAFRTAIAGQRILSGAFLDG